MVVLVVAGAGSRAMAWLLEVPGASRTVLEATVPYAPRAMEGLLGHEPEQYVSQETALDMARAAYRRALRLRPSQERVVGLACTATIATDRPKRGEHRCWIAAWDSEGAATCSLRLAKGLRDRPAEEDLVSRILLNSLAQANGLPERLPLDLAGEEAVEYGELEHPEPLRLLLYPQAGDERPRYVLAQPDGRREVEAPVRGAVLPGSFNPLHRGHVELARAASEILGQDVVFEMSVVNVDKPPLEEEEVRRRLNQFKDGWDGWTVALTRTPTFREEGWAIPGVPLRHWVGYGGAGGPGQVLWRGGGGGRSGTGRDTGGGVQVPGRGEESRAASSGRWRTWQSPGGSQTSSRPSQSPPSEQTYPPRSYGHRATPPKRRLLDIFLHLATSPGGMPRRRCPRSGLPLTECTRPH